MIFWMTPISIPGVSIRPPKLAPGEKPTTPKKKKRKSLKRKQPRRRSGSNSR